MSICIMKGCPNRRHVNKNIDHFKLPPTYEKRKRWLELCEAEDADFTSKSAVVCAEHFDPSYISRKGNKLILHPDAEPIPFAISRPDDSSQAIKVDIQESAYEPIITQLIVLENHPEESQIVTDMNSATGECLTLDQDGLEEEEVDSQIDVESSHLDLEDSQIDLEDSNVDLESSQMDLESSQMDLESSYMDLKSPQIGLEPADDYDVRCGEVFLSYTGVLAFYCSPCEKECGTYLSFVQHLKIVHYAELKEDPICNACEQKGNDDHKLESSLNESICQESVDIKQEQEPNSVNNFLNVELNPTFVPKATDPLNQIEQILIEETAPDIDTVQIEFEGEEKVDELSDVLSVSSDKREEKVKTSDSENSFDFPVNEQGKRTYKCNICKRVLVNAQVLKRHHDTVHSSKGNCKCEICGLKLKHFIYLKAHMLRHTGEKNIACDVCPKKFYTISEQRLHLRSHGIIYERPKPIPRKEKENEMVECDICHKTLKSKQTLRIHLKVVHSSSDQKYKCEICGLVLKHFSYIRQHMLRHTGEKNICCDVCSKKFYTMSEQRLHMRRHNAKKKKENCDEIAELFPCNICKKAFKTKLTLKKHERIHSTSEPQYKCNICGVAVKHYSYMKRHMVRHTGEKNVSCEICNKKFYTTSERKLHIRSHTGERPYVCSSCGMCFTNSSALTLHERIHNIEPPLRCEYCNKGFYSAYRMKGHMIVHTKEKPFSCPICSARFPRKRSMLRHIGLRHKKKAETNENDVELSC